MSKNGYIRPRTYRKEENILTDFPDFFNVPNAT